MPKIVPCLWFDNQAEEAVAFYASIFQDAKTLHVTRYAEAGQDVHGKPAGSVMTIAFEMLGQEFTALNGGPMFTFNEAISLQVNCATQEEVDYYWEKLSAGGDKNAQQCGWLKDKFGVSWQVIPVGLMKMLTSGDAAKTYRVMQALMQMKKLDLTALEDAYHG